ncbi:MAG: hypothetical protein J5493_00535 [Lachnospiraceae bacterium]|nr:hypothetical protein [Lachnospiraceae bacterium]
MADKRDLFEENSSREARDDAFDALLMDSLPPEADPSVSSSIAPGRQGMLFILISVALGLLTLHFLYLDLILPVISYGLGLLGWHRLKEANGSFRRGWTLQLVRTVLYLFFLFQQMSVWTMEEILTKVGYAAFGWVCTLLLMAQLYFLRQGIREVQRKAGQPEDTKAVNALIAEIAVLCVLGFLDVRGLLALIMIIVLIVCLKNLFKLTGALNEAGYALSGRPARIRPAVLLGIYAVLVLLVCALAPRSYPMQWQERQKVQQSAALAVAADLKAKGFPDEVMQDLTEEDLLSCEGAVSVMKYRSEVSTPDLDGLLLQAVAVVLDEGRGLGGAPRVWRIFYHFSLPDRDHGRGTEALEIPETLFRPFGGEDCVTETPCGWIFHEEKGKTVTAPISGIERKHYTTSPDLFGTYYTYDSWFAGFSLSSDCRRVRGYVALTVQDAYGEIDFSWDNAEPRIQDRYGTSSLCYIHQLRSLQFPVLSAVTWKTSGIQGEAFENIRLYGYFFPEQ